MNLKTFFSQNPRIAVAFSGGVDSSYLLYAAKTAGCDVRAYFIKTQFQPGFEQEDATRLAQALGVPLTVGELDVLRGPNIARNPRDRCYHCKTATLSKLWELARQDGMTVLCDGTNADDDETDRPGMRALEEQGVASPLRACGLAKADIRRLSKQAGLFTHDKPTYSCLATRIPSGTAITQELLGKIERAEKALFVMGFSNSRVRIMTQADATQADATQEGASQAGASQAGEIQAGASQAGASQAGETQAGATQAGAIQAGATQKRVSCATQVFARIQVPEDQWNDAASRRAEILASLKPDYAGIMLDLETR